MHESIAKYLANEMNEEERLTFEAQLVDDASLQNELYFQIEILERSSDSSPHFNSTKALDKALGRINEKQVIPISRNRNYSFLKIAATLLIVLTAGFFLSKSINNELPVEEITHSSNNWIHCYCRLVRSFHLSQGLC